MAESISEGTLRQFHKTIGDFVEQDEEIATIETDKIDVSVNSPSAGIIKEILAKEEDTVTVGQDIAVIEPKLGEQTEATPKTQASQSTTSEERPSSHQNPRPESIPTESPPPVDERTTHNLQKHRDDPEPHSQTEALAGSERKSSEHRSDAGRQERRVKMTRLRLRIAERLKQSQNTAASLTTFQEVDMSQLMDFRKRYKDEVYSKAGVKLGFMGPFSRAVVMAMRDIPSVNAAIEDNGDTVVYRDYVDLSVAVATEKGLVTPVIRNVESMDIVGIEASIASMGKKARDGKLTIEDMAGGTFTISNGGVFGSWMGTPIINLPQTAVLGLHAIKNKAWVLDDNEIAVRPIMVLALTYDHRLLDGREAVQFLVKVKELIEDPRRMLL
jgi:2-oxoglutarate dehydrogenase E2 component (dihydrolipoamide succinyltransferase)